MKDGYVSLPFGSEYTLLLKNLSSKRASVNISIDGEDVLDNSTLILDGNTESELRGFLKGNTARNGFRFIQKTEEIVNHRGDRIDDGMIRIEFAYEKPDPVFILLEDKKKEEDVHIYHHWNHNNWFSGDSTFRHSKGPENYTSNVRDQSRGIMNTTLATCENIGHVPMQDEGVTVKGSEVNQHFNYASIGSVEESQVIILRLRGATSSGASVKAPLTVKDKLECSSCGKKSNSSFKFCPSCGTFLE
jgi:hypothetical protein